MTNEYPKEVLPVIFCSQVTISSAISCSRWQSSFHCFGDTEALVPGFQILFLLLCSDLWWTSYLLSLIPLDYLTVCWRPAAYTSLACLYIPGLYAPAYLNYHHRRLFPRHHLLLSLSSLSSIPCPSGAPTFRFYVIGFFFMLEIIFPFFFFLVCSWSMWYLCVLDSVLTIYSIASTCCCSVKTSYSDYFGALTFSPPAFRPPVQFIFSLGVPIDPQRAV